MASLSCWGTRYVDKAIGERNRSCWADAVMFLQADAKETLQQAPLLCLVISAARNMLYAGGYIPKASRTFRPGAVAPSVHTASGALVGSPGLRHNEPTWHFHSVTAIHSTSQLPCSPPSILNHTHPRWSSTIHPLDAHSRAKAEIKLSLCHPGTGSTSHKCSVDQSSVPCPLLLTAWSLDAKF